MRRSRSPLSCRQGHKQVSQAIKQGTLLWLRPPPKNAKGHKGLKKKKKKTEGPKHRSGGSGAAFTFHCSQRQSLSWNSPVSLENLCPQPATTLVWLKSTSQPLWKHSLFEPRVGEACLDGRLISPNQGDRLLPGARGSLPTHAQFGV